MPKRKADGEEKDEDPKINASIPDGKEMESALNAKLHATLLTTMLTCDFTKTLETRDGKYTSNGVQLFGGSGSEGRWLVELKSNWVEILCHLHILTEFEPSSLLLDHSPGELSDADCSAIMRALNSGSNDPLVDGVCRVLGEIAQVPNWRAVVQPRARLEGIVCRTEVAARPVGRRAVESAVSKTGNGRQSAKKECAAVLLKIAQSPLLLVALVENLVLRTLVLEVKVKPALLSVQTMGQLDGKRVGLWMHQEKPPADEDINRLEEVISTRLRLPLTLTLRSWNALPVVAAVAAPVVSPAAPSAQANVMAGAVQDLGQTSGGTIQDSEIEAFEDLYQTLKIGRWKPFALYSPHTFNVLQLCCQLQDIALQEDRPGEAVSAHTLTWKVASTSLTPPTIFVRTN